MLDRKLLFVTGKGGVGKTTVAAALGLLAAQRGKRTLVCEIDAKGNLADFYAARPFTFDPREVQPRLWAMTMDTEASLKEYLQLQLRLPLMARVGMVSNVFEFVATAAPGVKEILTVGKPLWEVHEDNWDLVVVDSVASGHIVSQLAAPHAINELVQVGLIRQQTGWMLDILSDPVRTGLCIVATPEEMPVSETIELAQRVKAETRVDLAGVVVNRVLPELFGRGEEDVFEDLRGPARASEVEAALGSGAHLLLDAAELATTLRRTRAGHLERLRAGIAAGVPMLYVPELFGRSAGLRSTRQVADALSAELGW